MSNKIIVIGSSGHASVVIELLEQLNFQIVGCVDSFAPIGKKILNYKVIGNEFIFSSEKLETNQVFIAVGNNLHRFNLYKKLIEINTNLVFPSIISLSAIVSPSAKIGQGNLIMNRTIINANTQIGDFNVLNTGSIIEHDCRIESFTSVSPGAVLCGNVSLDHLSFVGASATIIQNKKISKNTVIGAGAVVNSDCESCSLYVGIPAKKIISNYNKVNYL